MTQEVSNRHTFSDIFLSSLHSTRRIRCRGSSPQHRRCRRASADNGEEGIRLDVHLRPAAHPATPRHRRQRRPPPPVDMHLHRPPPLPHDLLPARPPYLSSPGLSLPRPRAPVAELLRVEDHGGSQVPLRCRSRLQGTSAPRTELLTWTAPSLLHGLRASALSAQHARRPGPGARRRRRHIE
jgi:hypothetical protein